MQCETCAYYVYDDENNRGKSKRNDANEKIEVNTLKIVHEIIDYRNKQDFVYIEDIMNISGIGEKTFEKIRDYLCL